MPVPEPRQGRVLSLSQGHRWFNSPCPWDCPQSCWRAFYPVATPALPVEDLSPAPNGRRETGSLANLKDVYPSASHRTGRDTRIICSGSRRPDGVRRTVFTLERCLWKKKEWEAGPAEGAARPPCRGDTDSAREQRLPGTGAPPLKKGPGPAPGVPTRCPAALGLDLRPGWALLTSQLRGGTDWPWLLTSCLLGSPCSPQE